MQIVLDPDRHVESATLRHGFQWLHEVVGVQPNHCSGTDQREYVGLPSAEHSLGVAGNSLPRHARVPVECNAFKGTAVDHGLVGVYAIGELLLDLEVLTASVAQANLISAGYPRNPTERQNEKTRQKTGFSGVPEILKAFYGTLNGAGTRNRTRDLLITSQLLYQLSYTGNGASL